MGKKKKSRKDPEFSGLLLFMFQNRIPLLTITLAALVVSVVVSLLITPRYRSSVILYPANFTSISRSMMGPSSVRGDIMQFGQERDSERLLQVLNSEDIRSRIIEKFDLMQHYGIDPESSYPQITLNRKFQSNIRFRKTEYMAIEIEVLDADPAIAAAVANDIALFADSVINTILMERADHSLEIATEEYMRLKEEIAAIEDSLKKIREIGVIDYESQAEVLNDAYATSILNKDTAGMNFFRGRLRMLSSYGGAYVSLRDNLLYQNE